MAKKQRLIPEDSLPGPEARLAQAETAAAAFEAAGYARIGIDHFARPDDALAIARRDGRLRRNFQGYTTDAAATLLGIGATSIGKTPMGFAQNLPEPRAWARAVADGKLPIAKGVALTADDRLRGEVIEQLMCFGAVDLAETAERHAAARDWWRLEAAKLDEMARDGLIALDGPRLAVTAAGEPFLRVIAAVFDTYLAQGAARHSRVV